MLVLKDTGEGCHLVKYLVPHTLQPNEVEVTGSLPDDASVLELVGKKPKVSQRLKSKQKPEPTKFHKMESDPEFVAMIKRIVAEG